MIDWSTTYADLDEAQRRHVDEGRAYVTAQMLALEADYLRADPSRSGEIVDDLIEHGYLADHMAGLRWVASVLTPTTEG